MKNTFFTEIRQRMAKSVQLLHDQLLFVGQNPLNAVSALKATRSSVPLTQLATILFLPQRRMTITPHEKEFTDDIVQVIQRAKLGLTVLKEGAAIAVSAPHITVEQQTRLCKHVRRLGEAARVAIRSIRKESRTQLERANLPKDELRAATAKLQEITDEHIAAVDSHVLVKSQKLKE